MGYSEKQNNKRIAKNTLLLYIRQFLVMAVSLYTSRVVLEVLGVEDYGIYNVVGGVVGLLSVLSGSLSAAISRYITFEIGKGTIERLRNIFSTSLNIQIIISIIIVLLLEIVGMWFLNNKLDIAPERLATAEVVLHISMLTFLVNLLSIPFNATIIAHEKMNVFAYVSLLEVSLKLGFVFAMKIIHFDKLIIYAISLFILALIIRIVYGVYCKRHFVECRYQFRLDKSLLKEMIAFASWNYIGSSAAILKNYGVDIILNIFYGTTINAARGIAMQVNSAVNSFVNNFTTAINPQITKSYASGNHSYMMQLLVNGSKYSFFMLLLLSMPLLIETNHFLSIWLKVVPEYTVIFVRLMLIDSLINTISYPLITAMLATGKIKKYQIVVGGISLLNLPISYLFIKTGYSPEITIFVSILLSMLCLITRLFFLKYMINLSVIRYVRDVLLKVLIVSFFSLLLPLFLYSSISMSISRLIIIAICGCISVAVVVYLLGINKEERSVIKNYITSYTTK